MRLPSASALDRALACPTSCVLPRTRTSNSAAKRGTALHSFMEDVANLGRDKALERVPPELKHMAELIDLSSLPIDQSAYAAEVTLGWDHATGIGRELARGKSTPFERGKNEFIGIADVLTLTDRFVFVPDYKFGGGWTAPARESAQLRFLALAACAAYRRSAARVQIIRIRPDGTSYKDTADLGAFELDEFATMLRELVHRISKAREVVDQRRVPDTNQGDWCHFCPSWDFCPGKVQMIRTLAQRDWSISEGVTVEELRAFYGQAKELRSLNSRVWDRLKGLAQIEPIDLGGGRLYGPRSGRTIEYWAPKDRGDEDGSFARSDLPEMPTWE